MAEHPCPDDLVDWLNAYEWDDFGESAHAAHAAHAAHVYYGGCAVCRGDLARILAALAEWADGATHIALDGWKRLNAKEIGDGWYLNRFTGELVPWGAASPDDPIPPENRVYTLTERGQ